MQNKIPSSGNSALYGVLKIGLFNLVAFDEFLKGKHFAVKLQKIERLQIQAIMTNYFKVS